MKFSLNHKNNSLKFLMIIKSNGKEGKNLVQIKSKKKNAFIIEKDSIKDIICSYLLEIFRSE